MKEINYLFDFPEVEKIASSKGFLKEFLKASTLWENKEYITSCIQFGKKVSDDIAFGIFAKRIKSALNKLVLDEKIMTEDELRESLTVMIKTNTLFSYENIKKTKDEIEKGLHNELLNIVKEEIELESFCDGIDWGVL